MPIDTALIEALRVERFEEEDVIGALHVELLEREEVRAGERTHHALFQTSTIEALLDGNYEGDVSFAELGAYGDFGLGTFDALDGEMIGLDGTFYQVKADGRAYEVDERAKTPFAVVTFFEPREIRQLAAPMDYAALRAHLDEIVAGDVTTCHAVRVDGNFHYVKTRSVPRQHKPYPPLVEAVKHQPTFEFHDIRGSLVGFRFPDYIGGLNVSGYHFHFITEDRSAGGHLLECEIARGELRVDHESDLNLELPAGVSEAIPDLAQSKQDELKRIENA
ncbi:MAG: acetolactate decarboxylase [Rubrobacter sp.]|nr:acetolactate decarboxylase [Rubrobacter sp.]